MRGCWASHTAPQKIHVFAEKNLTEWVFSFADNGVGVDPQYSTGIFRVFKRWYPRSRCPGTGMGLSICQKTVERYGGKVWVEPNPGGGSIFKFTIAHNSTIPLTDPGLWTS